VVVKDLAVMENIVAKNNNLKWNGWNVLELKKSNLGRTDANGIRINDEWFIKREFTVTRNGWDIPNKYKE
jgi:hypothetical protein